MIKVTLSVITIIILGLALNYFLTTLFYWLVTWSFNLTFSWKISIGVWIISLVILGLVDSSRGVK